MLFLHLANKHLIFKVSLYKISKITKCYRSYNKHFKITTYTIYILPNTYVICIVRTDLMLTVKVDLLKQFLLKLKINFAHYERINCHLFYLGH